MNVRTVLTALTIGIAALTCAPVAMAGEAAERPLVHPLFSDHAVLQRDLAVPVWGWTAPGTKVRLTMGGKSAEATAGADGRWLAKMGPFPAGGPHTLVITGPKTVTVRDVLVGDVWICSGQSNMEMGIAACDANEDIASADFPRIRLLTVPKRVAPEPVETAELQWMACTPQSVNQGGWGGFSAVGYYFGRELHRELNVPIGLIHTSWGGTIAEAWTSAEGLQPLEDFRERLQQFSATVAAAKKGAGDYLQKLDAWYAANDPGTSQGWQKPEADIASWKSAEMPRHWEQAGLSDHDGLAWFRRDFTAPDAWAGKELVLSLGPIDDMDTTWINGQVVGRGDQWNADRVYKVPAGVVKPGRNVLSIRVLDTSGPGGLAGTAQQLRIAPAASVAGDGVSLAGAWLMRASTPLAQTQPLPARLDGNPNVTTVLYNGMVAPLLPFAVKGAIWYQGESNAGRAWQYRSLLPAMIKDWRHRFGVGDFPFYIVQLAAFQPTHPEPRENDWAELREAQALTAKNVPNCGLAVAIDIGDAQDIHPKNKRDVGRRLALTALGQTYGRNIVWSGPWYRSMEKTNRGIRLTFDHVGGGLVARGEKLTGFAVAGEDRKFVWADATIEGDTIVVSSPKVPGPVAVRYAWDINPVCNLYNKAGLPAVPFRTDDWPAVTVNNR